MKPLTSIIIVILFSVIAQLPILSLSSAAPDNATEPHLIFKKSIILKSHQNGKIYSEPYTIKQGEYLWKILREHYKINDQDIAFYCRLTRELNPELKDINYIPPKKNIIIPYRYVRQTSDKVTCTGDNATIAITLKQGDYLMRILRERCCIPDNFLFDPALIERIRAKNPHIDDLNSVAPGQTLYIPQSLCSCKKESIMRVQKEGSETEGREPHKPLDLQGQEYNLTRDTIGSVSDNTSQMISAQQSALALMSSYVTSFKGVENNSGETVLHIGNRGSVTLDRSIFPVYEFPWGKKIILDYGNRLPHEINQVIAGAWENAEIVALNSRDDFETILEKMLEKSGFYRVEKNSAFEITKDNVHISISSDWIVFRDETLKNIFIINLVQDKSSELPHSLKKYFEMEGLNLIEFQEPDNASSYSRIWYSKPEMHKSVNLPETISLVDTILELSGISFQKEYKVEIAPSATNGFSLEIFVDRMFVKDHETYVIDYHNLPPKIQTIFAEQGIKFNQINPHDTDKEQIIKKVLDFCGASYKASPVTFTYDRKTKSEIKITIPGLLLITSNSNVLFTPVDLNENIKTFLSENDVYIVRY